ncbi:hypothetical protein [Plesiomonas shigelloides]|uniref:hypothetical protein n=1 Tax=Plesiomonas shigelloides TaxID=703 RepID=UPI001C5AF5A5|nr:hypothetical protein [Plesiomonas shigelloides]MBW3794271.1 hypothetical protein [Plesiomonas shigelloides]MCX2499093.1 hypothetical protein [Plesiomonas shigelloides]
MGLFDIFDSAKRVEKAFNNLEVKYMSDQELAGITLGKISSKIPRTVAMKELVRRGYKKDGILFFLKD